jgi:hypothetical protein
MEEQILFEILATIEQSQHGIPVTALAAKFNQSVPEMADNLRGSMSLYILNPKAPLVELSRQGNDYIISFRIKNDANRTQRQRNAAKKAAHAVERHRNIQLCLHVREHVDSYKASWFRQAIDHDRAKASIGVKQLTEGMFDRGAYGRRLKQAVTAFDAIVDGKTEKSFDVSVSDMGKLSAALQACTQRNDTSRRAGGPRVSLRFHRSERPGLPSLSELPAEGIVGANAAIQLAPGKRLAKSVCLQDTAWFLEAFNQKWYRQKEQTSEAALKIVHRANERLELAGVRPKRHVSSAADRLRKLNRALFRRWDETRLVITPYLLNDGSLSA